MELVWNLGPPPTSKMTFIRALPLAPIIALKVPAASSHQRHGPVSAPHAFVGLTMLTPISKALLQSLVFDPF